MWHENEPTDTSETTTNCAYPTLPDLLSVRASLAEQIEAVAEAITAFNATGFEAEEKNRANCALARYLLSRASDYQKALWFAGGTKDYSKEDEALIALLTGPRPTPEQIIERLPKFDPPVVETSALPDAEVEI
jgi:hypothetical protein